MKFSKGAPIRLLAQDDLLPGDVLLFFATGILKHLITFGHAAIFYDRTKHGLPLLIESIGRGVLIRTLLCYQDRDIIVMRHHDPVAGSLAAKEAEHIADNPNSQYDYFSIPLFVAPKVILAKLIPWLPLSWRWLLKLQALAYHRNSVYICSELVEQAYFNSGYALISPDAGEPLPDDLYGSDTLYLVGKIPERKI